MKMKSVLLIGRYSVSTQHMSEYLGQYFLIQLCADNPEMLERSLDIALPDIAVLSLSGQIVVNNELISVLKERSGVPCICLGTAVEQDAVAQNCRSRQFYPLTMPADDSKLLSKIREVLHISPDGKDNTDKQCPVERKNILLVDDNPMQLRTLRALLKNDYDVSMALSGAEALAAIGKRVPDLIFLDYEMPVCDGAMTLKMIRGLDEAEDVPVVFLTAVQDKEHIVAVLALKPAGYLLKPTSQSQIEETVKKLL